MVHRFSKESGKLIFLQNAIAALFPENFLCARCRAKKLLPKRGRLLLKTQAALTFFAPVPIVGCGLQFVFVHHNR
jgi:hypothetical protein